MCGHHLGELGDVLDGFAVVTARRVGIINLDDVAIAILGAELSLAHAMTAILDVAVEASLARSRWPPAFEWRRADRIFSLVESLAQVEELYQTLLFYGGCLVGIGSVDDVVSRAQLTSGIPLVGREVADGLTDKIGVGDIRFGLGLRIIAARSEGHEPERG